MKILIAEDEKNLGIIMERIITRSGFSCDLVHNGQEAVNRITENEDQYGLCLMDIDMPVMNGCEAVRAIREKTKYFPIIAVTGEIGFEDKYADFGMDAIIKKPFDFKELIKKINEMIKDSKS